MPKEMGQKIECHVWMAPNMTYGWTNSIQARKCIPLGDSRVYLARKVQFWTNFYFLDWTFFSLISGQKDCLASLRSADNCPSSLRSRKKKSNLGKKSSSSIVFLAW